MTHGHPGWASTSPGYVTSHYMLLKSRTPSSLGSSPLSLRKAQLLTYYYTKYLKRCTIHFPITEALSFSEAGQALSYAQHLLCAGQQLVPGPCCRWQAGPEWYSPEH